MRAVNQVVWTIRIQKVRFPNLQRQVRFNRVPEKVPEKLGGFDAGPGQVQQGSGEGSGKGSGEGSSEGLGGFGAESGQVRFW